jgi:hypothetical protein
MNRPGAEPGRFISRAALSNAQANPGFAARKSSLPPGKAGYPSPRILGGIRKIDYVSEESSRPGTRRAEADTLPSDQYVLHPAEESNSPVVALEEMVNFPIAVADSFKLYQT